MIMFAAFALFLMVSAFLLVAVPVLLHPTLPRGKKMRLLAVCFLLVVPGAIALYAWLGVPAMGAMA